MNYTAEQTEKLHRKREEISRQLLSLGLEGMSQAREVEDEETRKYLNHGVGRRLSILKYSTEAIFSIFPPERDQVLTRDEVTAVQIYLHAFVINLFGVFENWAWAFIHRHNLSGEIGNVRNVGLFKRNTQRFLPDSLRNYLTSENISNWHEKYLKNYRDALAHRIPLYVPPAALSDEDGEKYKRLEVKKARLFREQKWDRLDEVWAEQDQIGAPCAVFMHEFSADGRSRQVFLHPQVLSDCITVVDFGTKFYEEWHSRA